MKLITQKISRKELEEIGKEHYGEVVKVVVDVKKKVMVAGGKYHAEAEDFLVSQGSDVRNVWGATIRFGDNMDIEYSALINIRPLKNNRFMEISDPKIREKVKKIINNLVIW